MVNPFNAEHRGVYIADNLDFLRGINSNSVDLVNIDPPFAKNDTFTADKLNPPFGFNKDGSKNDEQERETALLNRWLVYSPEDADKASIAWPGDDAEQKGGYRDTWNWDDDVHQDWLDGIKAIIPEIKDLIEVSKKIHGSDIAAYLSFMAIRLIEIHRILKPTGSLFIHCDHSANGYLRQLLDAIFGKDNFRNEIVWQYNKWTNTAAYFQRNHDTVFFYSKGNTYTFNKQYAITEHKAKVLAKGWDSNKVGKGEKKIRQLLVYNRELAAKEIANPKYDKIVYMDDKPEGTAMPDVWRDINYVASGARERTGYPTQKPIALAERIILTATNPGDTVLDVFAGCAYTAVAAERLDRQWTACDINPRSWTVFKRQFEGDKKKLVGKNLYCNDDPVEEQRPFLIEGFAGEIKLFGPGKLPKPTMPLIYKVKALQTDNRKKKDLKNNKSALFTDRKEMLNILLGFSSGRAWCCGFQSFNADGSFDLGNYELDHILPQSLGGDDDLDNRAPLCKAHNILKSNREIDLEELRVEVFEKQEQKVPARQLPKLTTMRKMALEAHTNAFLLNQSKQLV